MGIGLRRISNFFAGAVVLVTPIFVARADDAVGGSEWTAAAEPHGTPSLVPTPNQASDASFDKRLPPVLPGEKISDDGETVRVWSSSGAVSVSQPPEPWRAKSVGEATTGSSVIIDSRSRSNH